MTPDDGPPALPAPKRRRPRRRMLEGTAVVVALLAVAAPIAISAGSTDTGSVDTSLASGSGADEAAGPDALDPLPTDRPADAPLADGAEAEETPGPLPAGPDALAPESLGPDGLGPDGLETGLDGLGPDGLETGLDGLGPDGLETGLDGLDGTGGGPNDTPELGSPGGPAEPGGPLPPLLQTLPEIEVPPARQAPQFADSPPLPPSAQVPATPPAPPPVPVAEPPVPVAEPPVQDPPIVEFAPLPRVEGQVGLQIAPARGASPIRDRAAERPGEFSTETTEATGASGTPDPAGEPLLGTTLSSTEPAPVPVTEPVVGSNLASNGPVRAPAPAAPTRPTPAPAITAVNAGAVPTLPAGAGWGSPVVVTGRELQRAEYWSVGGRRVEPVRRSATEVLLMVRPGSSGRVAWHAGGRTEAHSLDLGSVLPQATGARPVVWGKGCATPADTGLVWVAGRIGSDIDVTSRTGERTIGDRTLRDGSVLATVGATPPPSIVVKRGAWATIVPIDAQTVDVTSLAALPALTGNDCPMSGGTSRIGIVTTGAPRDLKGLYTGTAERTPLRYVVISDDAIAVLLPRGAAAGTREVVVKGADGKMWRRPLQVVRPADGAVTTLADQIQKRS